MIAQFGLHRESQSSSASGPYRYGDGMTAPVMEHASTSKWSSR